MPFTYNYVSPVFPKLLDSIGTVLTLGTRKLHRKSTRAIRVRESGTNAELDIGFVGNELDTATLLTHCGSNSGYVVAWYDQSGLGNHAFQVVNAAYQPRIVNAGVLEVNATNKPQLYFDGSNDVMTIANHSSVNILAAPFMLNSVLSSSQNNGYILAKNGSGSTERQYSLTINSNLQIELTLENTARQTTAANSFPLNSQKILSELFTTGVQKAYINGVNSGSDGNYNGALTSRANMQIGARSDNAGGTAWAGFFKGYISEIIITTATTRRAEIEANQKSYYGL